jgi:hypothetical protein
LVPVFTNSPIKLTAIRKKYLEPFLEPFTQYALAAWHPKTGLDHFDAFSDYNFDTIVWLFCRMFKSESKVLSLRKSLCTGGN